MRSQSIWTQLSGLRGLLALALASGAMALLGFGLAETGAPLVVRIDGQRYELHTHAATVGAALEDEGLDLYPEDLVSPGVGTPLQAGTVVQIKRARLVTLSADGKIHQIRTQAKTIGELLAEAGVQLGPADEIWFEGRLVAPDTSFSSGGAQTRIVSDRGGGRFSPPSSAGQATGSEGLLNSAGAVGSDPPMITLRRAVSLALNDDGVTRTLYTTLSTVGQVLQEQGMILYLGDGVEPGLQDRVASGMVVTIHRSMPVKIEVDGHVIHTRTRAENVAIVLGQEGVALLGSDTVEPALDAAIRPNLTIRVTRVKEELVVELEPIPFNRLSVPDPNLEIDQRRLVQDGQIGLTKRRYRVEYENGQKVSRSLEDAWVAQPPITKTVAYGTKIVIRTLDTADGPIEYWRKIRAYTVSYTAATSGKAKTDPRYGYTRLGLKATKGIVAVDPTVIPLRTKMYVPGYGFAKAGDTGGGVKGKLIDLCFDVGAYESWHWWTDIYLLTPVPPRNTIRWVLPDWPNFPDRGRR